MPPIIALLFIALIYGSQANAVVETLEFSSELERERYYKFVEELRCPKCDNQNLLGSNSDIAKDLRHTLHRLLQEGRSDQEIVEFMVSRYGDFVLYRPPLKQTTWFLWFGPFILLGMGIMVFALILKRRVKENVSDQTNYDLSDEERERLAAVLNQKNLD